MWDELNMKVFLYTVSVITVVAWALCYFVYAYDSSVHLLLLFAMLIGLAGLVKKD